MLVILFHLLFWNSDFYHRVRSSRVVVIGIFGKTRISDEPLGKAYLFDDLMQRDVFRIADQNEGDDDDVTQNPNEVKLWLILIFLSLPICIVDFYF